MAHELEMVNGKAQMAYVGEKPWHRLGTEVEEGIMPLEMMEVAGLDWEVEKKDLTFLNREGERVRIPNKKVLTRKSDDKILDIVGDLFLLGGNVIGHYEGFRTGHMLNDQLLSAILSQPKAFSIETFEESDSPIQFYSEDWQNDL